MFYIEPTKSTLEEVLQKAENGIYINKLDGLHSGVNSISGDFSLKASGFAIEKGVLGKPLELMVVSGNFFDLLKNITGIADNLRFEPPTSNGTFGSPALLVEGIKIAGM